MSTKTALTALLQAVANLPREGPVIDSTAVIRDYQQFDCAKAIEPRIVIPHSSGDTWRRQGKRKGTKRR